MQQRSCFRLWLSYIGANFAGFQYQSESIRTVEGELSKALYAITGSLVKIVVAGRTDAGVHAHGQVVSISFDTRLNARQLTLALAAKLPIDLSVWRIDLMPLGFDARRQSVGKQYIYRIGQS
jgi:tRNA pseudouridine38-40 synthase